MEGWIIIWNLMKRNPSFGKPSIAGILYISRNAIDHTKTKARSPKTNVICEQFQRMILNEFYQVAFRKKIYTSLEELHAETDEWIMQCNEERPTAGDAAMKRRRYGRFWIHCMLQRRS